MPSYLKVQPPVLIQHLHEVTSCMEGFRTDTEIVSDAASGASATVGNAI